jgi:hypothetical protein
MSNLITKDYFRGNIYIPVDANEDLNEALNASISIYEPKILRLLLGYSLYKDFEAGRIEQIVAEKWSNLIDGAEFSFELNGNTIETKWEGLKNTTTYESLIAYYVYYYHRKDNETFNSTLGEQKAKTENSDRASFLSKMVNAQNKMVELYGNIPIMDRNFIDFRNLDRLIHFNDKPSAYNFLLANKSDYVNWVFTPISPKNIFGL